MTTKAISMLREGDRLRFADGVHTVQAVRRVRKGAGFAWRVTTDKGTGTLPYVGEVELAD